MYNLIFFSTLVAVLALAFFVKGVRQLLRRRVFSGVGLEFGALFFLAVAAVFLLLASNLYTYQRLVYEQPVVEINFTQIQPQLYRVGLNDLQTGDRRQLELLGDEWQLDAQVLSWKGLASLLGLDAGYRLHRLSGRYRDIEKARHAPRSVHSLVLPRTLDTEVAGQWVVDDWTLDIWALASRYADSLDFVDAAYGSAVFLPMTDGARYKVSLSRTGLIARPDNDVARKAVSHWIGL